MDVSKELILLFVGVIAGFVNVFAGGGSTLTLPALIFAGLDAATANGTNRIALIFQNLSGVTSFKRQKIKGLRIALKYALFTIPGAITGAFFSIKITHEWFERILAVIMIGVVISLFQKRGPQTKINIEQKEPSFLFFVSLFLVGFYGGFIQLGVGFILIAVLYHFLQTSLVQVNFNKLVIVLIYTIPAMLVFLINDKIDWSLGLMVAIGNTIGAWIAARVNVKKGDKLIRYVMSVAVVIMAIKLFL